MRLFIFTCVIIFAQGCSREVDINTIIKRYNTVDFSSLKNRFVHFRSAGNSRASSIYFVSEYNNNCSPYTVEVNNSDKKIIDINDSLVLPSCGKDYLTKNEIVSTINKYLSYHLCLLGVDDVGNVYINSYEQAPPILFRKTPRAKIDVQFELYKGNWYIRKQ